MSKTSSCEQFRELSKVQDKNLDLVEVALLIASEHCANLDIQKYKRKIDRLVEEAKSVIVKEGSAIAQAASLAHFLYVEKGFRGSNHEYYHPRNSFLNSVLDTKIGIPLSLSILYIAIGRKLGMTVHGISFPGHFLVSCQGVGEAIIDTFYGEILSYFECEERFRQIMGDQVPFKREYLMPSSNRDVIVRMLRNLKHVFARNGEYAQALKCSERILMFTPNQPFEVRDRGIFYHELECYSSALKDFEQFLQLAPGDSSSERIRAEVATLREQFGALH